MIITIFIILVRPRNIEKKNLETFYWRVTEVKNAVHFLEVTVLVCNKKKEIKKEVRRRYWERVGEEIMSERGSSRESERDRKGSKSQGSYRIRQYSIDWYTFQVMINKTISSVDWINSGTVWIPLV